MRRGAKSPTFAAQLRCQPLLLTPLLTPVSVDFLAAVSESSRLTCRGSEQASATQRWGWPCCWLGFAWCGMGVVSCSCVPGVSWESRLAGVTGAPRNYLDATWTVQPKFCPFHQPHKSFPVFPSFSRFTHNSQLHLENEQSPMQNAHEAALS